MKTLITGGTGFIGANLARKFLELGHDVHLIVRDTSDFKRLEPIKGEFGLHIIEITEAEAVNKFVSGLKPEIILHCATYGAYPGKQADVRATVLTNVLGTINLLNACAEVGFKCFVNTGSSSEYGEKDHPISEKDVLEPNNLYGVTKAAGTLYAQFLAKKSDLPIVTLRLFSPYGYFEEDGRLMPNLIRAAIENKKFSAPSPSLVRDFVFIEDVLGAYLKAVDNIDRVKGRILNIASGKQYSIAEVVDTVEKIFNKKIGVSYGEIATRQYEPKMWQADISEAKKMLSWEPKNSLKEGLGKFMDWLQKQTA